MKILKPFSRRLHGMLLVALAVAALCIVPQLSHAASPGQWQSGDLPFSGLPSGKPFHYDYLLPDNYNPSTKYPILVYEHEDCEGDAWYYGQNSDPLQLVDSGIMEFDSFNTSAFRSSYPAIVVVPYADQQSGCNDTVYNFGGYGDTPGSDPNEQAVVALVQYFESNFPVDTSRVYVTGDSLGGIGTDALMLDYNSLNGTVGKVFTAGLSYAGQIYRSPDPTQDQATVTRMKDVPLFAVSGSNDTTSPPDAFNRPMWQAYAGNSNYPSQSPGGEAGNSKFYYLEDPNLGHDVWGTYRGLPGGQPMYDWLFAQVGPGGSGSTGGATGGSGSTGTGSNTGTGGTNSGNTGGTVAIYLSASQNDVTSGTPVTLSWNAIQGTSCSGVNFTPTGTSGTLQVTPVRTTTYTITCNTSSFGVQSANTTVTVTSSGSSTGGNTGGSGNTGGTSSGGNSSDSTPRVDVPTVTPGSGTLTDLEGNVWAVDGSDMPTENGTEVQSDPVVLLLYTNDVIYEETVNNQWNFWNGLSWTAVSGDPREAASSYLAQTPPSSNSNSGTATGFAVGDKVQVIPGITLNVRDSAGVTGNRIGTEAAGAQGTIVDGPQSVSGVNWWQVSYADGTTGWSAEPYLMLANSSQGTSPSSQVFVTISVYPQTIGPGQSANLTWTSAAATSCTGPGINSISGFTAVSPTQTTTYTVTCTGPTGQSSASATLTYDPNLLPTPPASSLAVGDRVSAYDILQVYSTGSLSGSTLGVEKDGAQGTITDGPTQSNGRNWWDVQFDDGTTGWAVEDFLQFLSAPAPSNSGGSTGGSTGSTGGSGGGTPTGNFYVQNGQIIDPTGKVFIARGVDFLSDIIPDVIQGSGCTPFLSLFPGTNFVRFTFWWNQPSTDTLSSEINCLTSKHIVVEISNYNFWPNEISGQQLTDTANWYASWAQAYINNPYVWFNTLNEPTNNGGSVSAEHQAVYNAIRGTGSNAIIGIDAISAYNTNGLDTSVYGSMHNVYWDAHFYNWMSNYSTSLSDNQQALASEIAGLQAVQSGDGTMPVIIGEFGDSTDGTNIDPGWQQTVQAVTTSGYGYSAWTYYFPGASGDELVDQNSGQLTAYGQMLANAIAGN